MTANATFFSAPEGFDTRGHPSMPCGHASGLPGKINRGKISLKSAAICGYLGNAS